MNRKGKVGCWFLVIWIVSFCIMAIVLANSLDKLTGRVDIISRVQVINNYEIVKNREANDYIKSVFWKQAEGLKEVREMLNLEPIKEHGHIGMYGPVRRGENVK